MAVIRLDFCAGDRPDVLGLGLEVGLLQTLDRSWWGKEREQHTSYVGRVKLWLAETKIIRKIVPNLA